MLIHMLNYTSNLVLGDDHDDDLELILLDISQNEELKTSVVHK